MGFLIVRFDDDGTGPPAAPANAENVVFQGVASNNDPTQLNVSAWVPKMKPSGAGSQGGLTPDPGGSSGTSKFLREDATWQVPSGGGGGMPAGSNVVIAAVRSGMDSGYSGLSIQKKLAAGEMLNLAASWKFSIKFESGVNYTANAVVYRTLIDDLTVVDATVVTWGSSSTVNFTATGETFSDPIGIALDTDHDYYIVLYFQSGTGTIDIYSTPGTILPGETGTGFASGDRTGLTTGGTVLVSVSPEESLYRVIST